MKRHHAEAVLEIAGRESPVLERYMESLCGALDVHFPPRTLQEQQADQYQRDAIASANSFQPFN